MKEFKEFNDISFSIKKKFQKHFRNTAKQYEKLGKLYWNIFNYKKDQA